MVPVVVGAADDLDGPGPLPWRVGGKLGFTVDAAAFPDSADMVLEVYIRLPPATLASLARPPGGESRLRTTVRLRNRFGALHRQVSQEFTVAPRDTGGGFGKVVMLPFPVKSGAYQMHVKLEDLMSRKRGLAYVGRRVAEASAVEGQVSVPQPEDGRWLSDIEFVWGEAAPRAAAFRHGGVETGLLPNPERLYGLLATDLRAQFAVSTPVVELRPWRWRASILDAQDQVLAQRETTVAAARPLVQSLAFDVSTVPAGAYDLVVHAWQENDERPLVRRSRFSVAWQPSSWMRNPRDVEDEVHFLLDGEDEAEFARMSPGEQERYLEDFWRERDPTPGTAENEVRKQFSERVEYSNRTWTRTAIDKGMFTDMGRVYIRHGEPDEILRQVIPAGDQTLNHLLQQLALSEDRPTGEVRTKGLGGDVRPFEVWIYDGARARPVTAKPDGSGSTKTLRRLLFLFVDEQGYGDYRLRYSTE